jgi:hypothetical protein
VFARCGKFMVVTALVLTTGLHWAALQTVAWTTMLASNLCDDSFSQAVDKTFDGMHPCCLCKAIAAARKSEKKSESVAPALKMEFPPMAEKTILIPPAQFKFFPLKNTFAEYFSSEPLLPPPRVASPDQVPFFQPTS